MAHNTKPILVDVNGKPIPQYFDPLADEYKPLLGQHGAARSILYGPDGNPISDTNKLPVRASELEDLIGALNASAVTNPANAASVIAALKGLLSVVGKEATLGQILSALAPLATETTLGQAVQKLTDLLERLENALDVDVSDNAERELGKVTLTGHLPPSAMEMSVNSWDELPAPAETPKGATAQLIGTFDVRQNTGTEWVEVVL